MIDPSSRLPEDDSEAARIAAVYARYDADARAAARWAPGNLGNVLMRAEFTTAFAALLVRAGVRLDEATILDAGCGWGVNLQWLAERGACPERLYGVDLLAERIELARVRCPGMNLSCADVRHLSFFDRFFDVILCINLFGSVLHRAVAEAIAAELRRVLNPRGLIVWCDSRYWNPWNSSVRGYSGTDIRRLFPGSRVELRSITVVPQLVRRLGPLAPTFYPFLQRIPLLRVRYLGIIKPTETRSLTPVSGAQ